QTKEAAVPTETKGSGSGAMPEGKAAAFREVLPKQGQLSAEDVPAMVLCKPKVLPLKSVALEKLEELQRAAAEAAGKASGGAPGTQS
uniref:BBSome-interacting protein 1 n=1 Tax=Cairina moschata TaxID=8855 RepID=A0A8C3BEM1_CAIMO